MCIRDRVTFRRVVIPVQELLDTAGKYFRKSMKNRTERIELEIGTVDAKVIGDLNQLRFLLENLIDEALAVHEDGLDVYKRQEQEVVRMDVLFSGGRWQQSQKLQALFTNRMLREGTTKYTAATIAENLDYYGSWLELSSSSEYAYITVYSLNKYLAKTLEVVESMIKEPLFPQKELQTILDTNIQQYLVNTSKVCLLYTSL